MSLKVIVTVRGYGFQVSYGPWQRFTNVRMFTNVFLITNLRTHFLRNVIGYNK